MCTPKSLQEATGRKWLSASQGERPEGKPNLPTPWSQPPELWDITFLSFNRPSVVFYYGNLSELAHREDKRLPTVVVVATTQALDTWRSPILFLNMNILQNHTAKSIGFLCWAWKESCSGGLTGRWTFSRVVMGNERSKCSKDIRTIPVNCVTK